MSELKWIWLSQKCGVGSSDIFTLVSKSRGIDDIYSFDYDTYIRLGVSERGADRLCDKGLDDAYRISEWCKKNSVGILTFDSKAYPHSLRLIQNPPAVLYYIGKLPDFDRELFISVVGTRRMSEYGMKSAYKIAYELAYAGVVTVSGMALGIDGVVACASVAAGGKTVAVLGCGIDIVYPKEHARLKEIITENGAVITEYPPSTEPRGYNFPIRNRLISGLSSGTLVVDAPIGSGSLITAKNAIIQGKDIYAVPGNIDGENNSGTNSLIRDGAIAVSCGRDIIKNYAYMYPETVSMQRLMRAESQSEFDPSRLLSMKVGMRISTPVKPEMTNEKITPKNRVKTEDPEGSKKKSRQRNEGNQIPNKDLPKTESRREARIGESEKAISSLTERQREIFSEMPMDTPVTLDYFVKSGFTMGEVMSTLTVLEIRGLISSLPGALYIRR